MASHRALGPIPTILEGQELKDTVDDGHNDGERQQVGVGLQEGNLGWGWGDGREHRQAPAEADRRHSLLAGPPLLPLAPEEPDDIPTDLTPGLPRRGCAGQEESRSEMGRWAQSGWATAGGKWGQRRGGGTAMGAGRVITERYAGTVGARDRNPTPETAQASAAKTQHARGGQRRMLLKDTGRVSRDLELEPKGRAAGRGAEGASLDPEGRPGKQKSHSKDSQGSRRGRTPSVSQGQSPSVCFLPLTGRGPGRL